MDFSNIKCYKLKHDYWIWYSGYKYEKGTLFVEVSTTTIYHRKKIMRLATPTKSHGGIGLWHLLEQLLKLGENWIERVDLNKEKWVHPHLHKEFYYHCKKNKLLNDESKDTSKESSQKENKE